jgi:hypothetical protein
MSVKTQRCGIRNITIIYYIRRATCFESPESSSGPQETDPYNTRGNALWDPQRLQ